MGFFVLGGGISRFIRPQKKAGEGDKEKHSYVNAGVSAVRSALKDSAIPYSQVQACVCSYNYCGPTAGQAVVYHVGLTGIPIYNTNNNCSSGSAALSLATNLLSSGEKDVVLVVGFEQMERGLSEPFPDKPSPTQVQTNGMRGLGLDPTPLPGSNQFTSDVIKVFAQAANEYTAKYSSLSPKVFAEIAHKNREHGFHNENALFYGSKVPSVDQMMERTLVPPITAYMSAPTCDGAAAIVLVSDRFLSRPEISSSLSPETRLVELLGISVATDNPSTIQTAAGMCGLPLATEAAKSAFCKAEKASRGMIQGIRDVDVVELHDCFAPAELLLYEALGLCQEGGARELWEGRKEVIGPHGEKHTRLCNHQSGGKWVVNPSGGLESKGHPIGATGIAQTVEIALQLKGKGGKRQVHSNDASNSQLPRAALQHNFGFNGGAIVSIYRSLKLSDLYVDGGRAWYALEMTSALTPSPSVISPFRRLSPEERKALVLSGAPKGWGTITEDIHLRFSPSSNKIRGKIPNDLVGTFLRNGPGVMNVYGTPLSHPIDGDGMAVCVSFSGGGVEIHSSFVDTRTRKAERKAGAMLHRGQMGSKTPDNQLNAPWRDPAHTNIIHIGEKILALHEYALPYLLHPVTLKTIGVEDFGGRLRKRKVPNGDKIGGSLCAHFRYDPIRQLSIFVSFSPARMTSPPYVTFYEVNERCEVISETTAAVPHLNYVHDLCVTPSYYIVQMTPFVNVSLSKISSILQGESSPGEQLKYAPGLPCKIVLVKRPLIGEERRGEGVVEYEHMGEYPNVMEFELPEPIHIYHFSRAVEVAVEELKRGGPETEPWEKGRFGEYEEDSPFLIPPNRLSSRAQPNTEFYSDRTAPASSLNQEGEDRVPPFPPGSIRTVAIEIEACVLQRGFTMEFQDSLFLFNGSDAPGRMAKIVCRMGSSAATMSVIDSSSCEFPIINPDRHLSLALFRNEKEGVQQISPSSSSSSFNLTNSHSPVLYDDPLTAAGVPCALQSLPPSLPPPPQFTYLMANTHGVGLPYCDIVKIDAFHSSGRQVWCAGPMSMVGEPCFFPKAGKERREEDDGYLVVQVQRIDKEKTEFVVLETKDLTRGPIAIVETDVLIPNGFHGTFSPSLCGRESDRVQSKL